MNPAAIGVLAGAVGTVGLASYAVWTHVNADVEPEPRAPTPLALERTSADDSSVVGVIAPLAAPSDRGQRDALRTELLQAGYRHPRALEWYALSRASLALITPVLVWLVMGERADSRMDVAVVALLGASLGYYAPFVWMRNRRANRQAEMMRVFPNFLDLLVSCLEAGLGVDEALRNVTREIRFASATLGDEMERVNDELAAGIPRLQALRNLDRRLGIEEVHSLVNVLAQAERFGTGIAASIRAHAKLTRRMRMLQAEERAARVAPRLTVAMVIFILPPLFIVLMGPAVVRIVDTLLPTLAGIQ